MNSKPETPKLIPLLYKAKQLRELLGFSNSTIWRMVKKGVFPQPFKIGGATYWKAQEVLNFVEDMANTRNDNNEKSELVEDDRK